MVLEHRGVYRSESATICSIASQFGCSSETLHKWVRQAEQDKGLRPGLSSDQLAELRELEQSLTERNGMKRVGRPGFEPEPAEETS